MARTKEIQYITISDLVDKSWYNDDEMYFGEHFGILMNHGSVPANEWMLPYQPYRSKEYRIIRIHTGWCRYIINMREYYQKRNTINILPPGSLIMKVEESPGHGSEIISIDDIGDLSARVPQGTDFVFDVSEDQGQRVGAYYDFLIKQLNAGTLNDESIKSIVRSLLCFDLQLYDELHQTETEVKASPHEELYNRFVKMLGKYGNRKHEIPFYADRLFVSPNHLSKVVMEQSDRTVAEWINQSVMMEARMLLLYSDMTVLEISDRLDFPNSPYFCRFFKREMGMTPSEYRKSFLNDKHKN